MTLKSDAKFGKKLPCCLENDMRSWNKIKTLWDPFAQSRKCMTLKFTEELCVMAMKNDTKTEEELTCRFEIDMNFTIFDPTTWKV